MAIFDPPTLRSDFVLVASSEAASLAAMVTSYLFSAEHYLPLFSFQKVDVAKDENIGKPDIYLLQRRRSNHFSVYLNNALAELSSCENLVYIGLSEQQRSYLNVERHFNLFEINDEADVINFLTGYAYYKADPITCHPDQIKDGLLVALKQNRLLHFGAFNENLEVPVGKDSGVVIIESETGLSDVIAVNYACSIDAAVHFAPKLEKFEDDEVLQLMEAGSAGQQDALRQVKQKIYQRLAGAELNGKAFVTCFTSGLPYSLVLDGLQVSQVNLDYRPDFFIYNSILNEHRHIAGSAVVFSTLSFKTEEVTKLSSILEFENIYQRKMLGKFATSYNLKTTVEHYPFDLLHICSHGGRVNGSRCLVEFKDDRGDDHSMEFDHILGIHLTPYEDLHQVESLYYFRKFNGIAWRSSQLKAQDYPHELYAMIEGKISEAFNKKRVKHLDKIDSVPNTNAIKCSDFNYLGHFAQIAAFESHPFVFNNSCWSWRKIADNFLAAGAKGYIGTICEVDNAFAVRLAEAFYEKAFYSGTVAEALFLAVNETLTVGQENPYVFWGLHFTTIKNRENINANKVRVLQGLGRNNGTWNRKLRKKDRKEAEAILGILKDIDWMLKDVLATDGENSPRQ